MAAPAEGESGAAAHGAPRARPQIRGAQSSSSILVNSCQVRGALTQRGNPVLQHIKGIAWEYADIVPDYQVGLSSGVLFLSLRYHRLHPEYIHTRIQRLAHMYTLRVLLVMCDVQDHEAALRELTKIALVHRMALIEAGRYLEMYKAYEQKPPDMIRSRGGDSYMSVLTSVLTSVRGINKTDVLTLSSRYPSLADLTAQSAEQLLMLPGMGDIKAQNLVRAFQQPFFMETERVAPGAAAQEIRGAAPDPHVAEEDGAQDRPDPAAGAAYSFDNLPPDFESLPEEEQLRIAMQLSTS